MQNRPCRLLLIQGLKRSPINLRLVFGIPKERNPKGLALFCSALIRLAKLGLSDEKQARLLLQELLTFRSPGWDWTCWGYNFDWQTRTYLVPRFSPNIICTTFAGHALLDGYQAFRDPALLKHALSAGEFLLHGLGRTGTADNFCFSYTTLDRSEIHNANLLGAAFLARLYSLNGPDALLPHIRASVRYSLDRLRPDGSWPYGEGPKQRWVDSFHTGYNLVALNRVRNLTGDETLDEPIRTAFRFYKTHFFTPEGVVRYYHDRTFPIDTHAIAQAIITLMEMMDFDSDGALRLATNVCRWGLTHMRSPSGWFYYQKHPWLTIKIPYMRWCQAWMLLAMAVLAEGMPDFGFRRGISRLPT